MASTGNQHSDYLTYKNTQANLNDFSQHSDNLKTSNTSKNKKVNKQNRRVQFNLDKNETQEFTRDAIVNTI